MKLFFQYGLLLFILMNNIVVYSQHWNLVIEECNLTNLYSCKSVDNDSALLGVGKAWNQASEVEPYNGLIVKVDLEGNYIYRVVQNVSMDLSYYSVIQLNDGNYMAFGICDSLTQLDYRKYLRVDVYDKQLNLISNHLIDATTNEFLGFQKDQECDRIQCGMNSDGNVLLATSQCFISDLGYLENRFRFYEFNPSGDSIRSVAQPIAIDGYPQYGYKIALVMSNPDTTGYMAIASGTYNNHWSGMFGIYWIDDNLNIVDNKPWMSNGDISSCDNHWHFLDENHQKSLLVDIEKYIGSSFSYHSLCFVSEKFVKYKEVDLPPLDSVSTVNSFTSTVFINDSTIFATTYSSVSFWDDECQTNVFLTDSDLNILGRKTIKESDQYILPLMPVGLCDGSCMMPIRFQFESKNDGIYQSKIAFYKFFRNDFEITLNIEGNNCILQDKEVYPNPTNGILNIPVIGITPDVSRIQVFDVLGQKCLDANINKNGNLITIDTQNLEAGTYIYQVVSADRILTKGKFVKE